MRATPSSPRRPRSPSGRPWSRRLATLAILAVLLLPQAAAHLQGARPVLQLNERGRIVDLQPEGFAVRAGLSLSGEPLRHYIAHDLDPRTGAFALEYRRDASRSETAFDSVWKVGRLVEYRDTNTNGRYEQTIDGAARVWRFTAYEWERPIIQRVEVGGVTATSAVWSGNLSGAPRIRLEVVVAGQDFVDEGVRVRPQDAAMYLDFLDLPTRGVGNLYAFEWEVTVPEDGRLTFHTVEGTPTALVALADLQSSFFLWGGEALLDGAETRFNATLEDERVAGGNRTARLLLHLPTADDSIRFALVSALEYGTESRRQPIGLPVVVLAVTLAALLAAGRRRR